MGVFKFILDCLDHFDFEYEVFLIRVHTTLGAGTSGQSCWLANHM